MKTFFLFCLLISILKPAIASIEYIENQIFETEQLRQGDWSSGGGNAVVCFEDGQARTAISEVRAAGGIIPNHILDFIISIEMYDLFEAKLPRGIDDTSPPEIIEIQDHQTLTGYSHYLEQRFLKIFPAMTNVISQGRGLIPESNIRFHAGAVRQQNDLGDTTHVDSNRCVIQTMAVQRNWSNFHELHIDARLFNHPAHSRQSKATLLLHEYIYAYSRNKLSHTDSSQTRKMVEMSISHHQSMTYEYTARMITYLGYSSLTSGLDHPRAFVLEHDFFYQIYPLLKQAIENTVTLLNTVQPEGTRKLIQDYNERARSSNVAISENTRFRQLYDDFQNPYHLWSSPGFSDLRARLEDLKTKLNQTVAFQLSMSFSPIEVSIRRHENLPQEAKEEISSSLSMLRNYYVEIMNQPIVPYYLGGPREPLTHYCWTSSCDSKYELLSHGELKLFSFSNYLVPTLTFTGIE
jgi:hypothetical protein